MDDRRFDTLTRSLAQGGSRRAVLKTLLGLGGVATVGTLLAPSSEAARRSTPTPKPVTCPGIQVWNGAECLCPTGTQCGPDCCPAGAQCCDNACCYGVCIGEELCCPAAQSFCDSTGECCPEGWRCCAERGCIGPDQCCAAEDCPAEACFQRDCSPDTGTCSEAIFDCTLDPSCCDSGNVCAAEICNTETAMCEVGAALSCGCATASDGQQVSCGRCGPDAPCCSNGTCGACPSCVCPHGPNVVTLADGTTRLSNGGAVCLSPCSSDADCPCNQVCIATYTLCLPGVPVVDCTSTGRPPGAYCGAFGACTSG